MSRGSIDVPPGTTRHRLRMYVSGRQETIGFYATRAAAELAREEHNAILEETRGDYEGVLLSPYAHKFLTRREVKRTVRDPASDWSRFEVHIKADPIGRMAIRAVQSRHVYAWLERLEDKGLAGQTRRNCLVLLRTIFRSAHKSGLVRSNPVHGIRVEGKDRDAWTYLSYDELPRLLDACDPGVTRHLAAVAVGTGVRPGELVTLRRADVHLDDRPRLVVRYGAAPAEPTKTGAVRTVHLFGLALVAMRSWLGRPGADNPHGLVFPRERGGFRDSDHVIPWTEWKAVLDGAKLGRRFRWYDLRHTCASWLVSGWWGHRWSLQEVKEMLGHTSITITQRYAHLAGSASEEVARLTGKEVNASQLGGARDVPALSAGTPEKTGPTSDAPPGGVEPPTSGLGIHGFLRSKADIGPIDSSLTELLRRTQAAIHTPAGRGGEVGS